MLNTCRSSVFRWFSKTWTLSRAASPIAITYVLMLSRLWKPFTSFARLLLHGPLCLPSVRYTMSMFGVEHVEAHTVQWAMSGRHTWWRQWCEWTPLGTGHVWWHWIFHTCPCAVEAEFKVDVQTICNHSNSEMVTEFLRHECQQVLHSHKLRSSNASRCIKYEQNISNVVSVSDPMKCIHTFSSHSNLINLLLTYIYTHTTPSL